MVRSDTLDKIESGDIFIDSLSTSTMTGFAPVRSTALIVATKVRSGTITSSFFPIPSAFKERCNADVALETPTAYLE